MKLGFIASLTLAGALAVLQVPTGAAAKELKVISDKTVTGFGHVESVAYDPREKVFYTGDFGPDLKPGDKDGKGFITKVSLDGKILDKRFFPPEGQTMNKPKGIWIRGNRLWVTDIDAVWLIDLKTKQSKKLDLPGIQFANDPAVVGNALYVSDNRADQLFKVEPADFLKSKDAPKITVVFKGKGVFPNGLYPGPDGKLYMVGFEGKDKPHGIYSMVPGHDPTLLSDNIGMLDGLYRLTNGDILATDWVSGSLFRWTKKDGMQKLAGDFKGPADFCVVPNKDGYLVAVPDLVKGEIRMIQLGAK
ncbi:MAG TPA: hypothetical protein VFB31_09935 [Pseudolabrys sp.]|nr:hypothetical protein [Pseudolabrys sp.]